MNGIRSSSNAVSLDGSNVIDFGANSGVMIGLNNDMVQEVKIQSSNFGAEFGSGAVNVSAVTRSGNSQFAGTPVTITSAIGGSLPPTGRTPSSVSSSRRAASSIRVATSAARFRFRSLSTTRTGTDSSSGWGWKSSDRSWTPAAT